MSSNHVTAAAVGAMKYCETAMKGRSADASNIATFGYKATRTVTSEGPAQIIQSAGAETGEDGKQPVGVVISGGCNVIANHKIFKQGSLTETESPTHLAIVGEGFFEITKDGKPAYVRAGDFQKGTEGKWVTTNGGYEVGGGFKAIPPGGEIIIDPSGAATITVRDKDGTKTENFKIQLAYFDNPHLLEEREGGIYYPTEASGEAKLNDPGTGGVGYLKHRHLEESTVDPLTIMTEISLLENRHKQFSKIIQVGEKMLENEANIL